MTIRLPKDIYWMWLQVYIGNKEAFEKKTKTNQTEYEWLFIGDWPQCYLYIDTYDTGTLIHELSHFAIYTFERIGMEISTATEEAFAYYIEHTYNRIQYHYNKHLAHTNTNG